ncbi:MAG: response regulator [Chloroflexi bacterium]|nr:response regulator [Chloroflexota bacterium]
MTRAPFERDLHRVLEHLYDPAELARSPLVGLFGLGRRDDPASALQRLLLDAIQALKPRADVPSDANARRLSYILSQRYAAQFSQADIAANLAIGERHVRRLQVEARQVLADYLWAHYNLEDKTTTPSPSLPPAGSPASPSDLPGQEQELAWVRSYPNEPVDLASLVQVLSRTVGPLLQSLGVRIEIALPEDLPRLSVQAMATRQAVLNVLTAAIRAVPGGWIHVEARANCGQVIVTIRATTDGRSAAGPLPEKARQSLEMARKLAELSDGRLEVRSGQDAPGPFNAQMILPAAEQVPVLVVDDNADTLQLFRRYLEGSRYRFLGARDPQEALTLAEERPTEIIVLDVMLPGVDGWELLRRLRESSRTRRVPVVICTILPEDELALALGAAAFIRKPVSQTAFLAALDRQLDPRRESR